MTELKSLLGKLCVDRKIKVQAIEGRAKDVNSLVDKFKRHPEYELLSDCEDLCGVRIITFYLSDIPLVRNLIRDQFEVLKEEDRRAPLPEAFGYQSLHLVGRLNKQRRSLPEYRDFADFVIEFQVRTVLQHAWGVISHALDYKTEDEVPAEVRRKLFRVAALLETGDELFGTFRTEIEGLRNRYKDQATGQEWRELPLNLDSTLASWTRMPLAEVKRVAVKAGFGPYDFRDTSSLDLRRSLSKLVSLATVAGYRTMGELANEMSNVESERTRLTAVRRECVKRGFTPRGDPVDIMVLFMLLQDPDLRARMAASFRSQLEEALDIVLNGGHGQEPEARSTP
ncbi:hypothetical protein [Nonomuraea sp. PA05]|uniref:hypothetical protein n=1 Tax=Nonomuraea sp. PA05 TaxID=2604466 RepID=UPI001651D361|nr:hypothetical protein [Nonomuraea sp. PA05]